MKKKELKTGQVVELRNGEEYVVVWNCFDTDYCKNVLIKLSDKCMISIDHYNNNLKVAGREFDIMKVYNNFSKTKLIWERETPELSNNELIILKNVNICYNYIARDENGKLHIFSDVPIKGEHRWVAKGKDNKCCLLPYVNLFQFIKFKNKEPYIIANLIQGS